MKYIALAILLTLICTTASAQSLYGGYGRYGNATMRTYGGYGNRIMTRYGRPVTYGHRKVYRPVQVYWYPRYRSYVWRY